jgi:flagellar hook protein FlgE
MDAFAIAASGMQAAQTQINVAANNIANQSTP